MAVAKRLVVKIVAIVLIVIGFAVILNFFFPKIFGDVIYPMEYEDLIIKYSRQYAVEPSLTAAVIYTESHFDPNAGSHAGAEGLMQIMPATGEAIASRLGEPFGDLFDPETSIRYGTSYLRSLIDAYNLDIDAALAAYNGGSGAADRYVITRSDADIPAETANYIKKVNAAQETYEMLYGDILNAQNVTDALKIKQEEQAKPWYVKLLEKFGYQSK
jgi:soluble lytic murein transglycosylase